MARPGRPRGFDRDAAVRQAPHVFWARGYDGATLTELQAAMGGLAAPGFYAAFGSKEELFREAIDLYVSRPSARRCSARSKTRRTRRAASRACSAPLWACSTRVTALMAACWCLVR